MEDLYHSALTIVSLASTYNVQCTPGYTHPCTCTCTKFQGVNVVASIYTYWHAIYMKLQRCQEWKFSPISPPTLIHGIFLSFELFALWYCYTQDMAILPIIIGENLIFLWCKGSCTLQVFCPAKHSISTKWGKISHYAECISGGPGGAPPSRIDFPPWQLASLFFMRDCSPFDLYLPPLENCHYAFAPS